MVILAFGMYNIQRKLSTKKITLIKDILTLYILLISMGISFIIEMQVLWALLLGDANEVDNIVAFLSIILVTSALFLVAFLTVDWLLERKEIALKLSAAGSN